MSTMHRALVIPVLLLLAIMNCRPSQWYCLARLHWNIENENNASKYNHTATKIIMTMTTTTIYFISAFGCCSYKMRQYYNDSSSRHSCVFSRLVSRDTLCPACAASNIRSFTAGAVDGWLCSGHSAVTSSRDHVTWRDVVTWRDQLQSWRYSDVSGAITPHRRITIHSPPFRSSVWLLTDEHLSLPQGIYSRQPCTNRDARGNCACTVTSNVEPFCHQQHIVSFSRHDWVSRVLSWLFATQREPDQPELRYRAQN